METSKLNETFIPKQIVKKTQIANQNAILTTNQFEKTAGNAYIEFDPVEVKFSGYQLGKTHTAIVKIINKSPIPQRMHILPPTQPAFSIKVNKKGPIAAGMSENILISFNSNEYKYQYDIVKVNSETGNFVIPVYAYPSIPKIQQIFPKIIDFGAVPVNESNSYMYPINNPVPMDFIYEFNYIQESPAFIITPIRGTIASSSTQNIQITFIPSDKKTFVAEVVLNIKQFDFEPIKIKLLGSGKQKKQGLSSTRRIKSSKLNPLIKTQSKIVQPGGQVQNQVKVLDLNNTIQKKTFIRSKASFPKLLKKTSGLNNQMAGLSQIDKLETSVKKQNQRDFSNQFSKIQQLDKQKQIKFSQFLGDRAMNQEQIQFEQKIIFQTNKARLQNFKDFCTNRHENQLRSDGEVDLNKFVPQITSWDINKNNELKLRRQKLYKFMRAGTRIIKKYRLTKRLKKIQEFLSDCQSKEEVKKKVQEDYAKSLDLSKQGFKKAHQKLTFSLENLQASSFPLQFKDESQSIKKTFQTEGSTNFDDDKILQQSKPSQLQILSYNNANFPSDFIYLTKSIPVSRKSAQQQYPLKTAALPTYQMIQPSSVYKLPLKVPTHQFIYDSYEMCRYKTSNPVDEKDPQYLINSTLQHVEDQFQGWSKGEMDILKTKFQRNMGCQFSGISLYNYPETGDLGFMGELGSHLPKQIGNLEVTKDDMIEQGDSDEQKINNIQVQKAENVISKIQEKNTKAKERRQKNIMQNFEGMLLSVVEKNLQSIKLANIAQAIDKIASYNKWSENKQNRVLI